MKKALLTLRVPIETLFGLLYMSSLLLLLPDVYRSYFPQAIIVGYLGMPRHYSDPAVMNRFNAIAAVVGVLIVAFLFLTGLLWFKDVRDIIRKLRAEQQGT